MSDSTRCPDCDHDPADWTVRDMRSTLRHLPGFWEYTTERLDAAAARPHRDRAAEHLTHLGAQLGLTGDDEALADALADDASETLLGEALHAMVHGVRLGGRALAAAGVLGDPQQGRVDQISASGGGVPKTALDEAAVTRRGLVGDRQNDRVHHGRPFQAVCLWSTEVLTALQQEGHPIGAGYAGENLTLSGLTWADVRPGVQLAVGDDLVVEISSYAIPCAHQKPWFSDHKFRRILHEENPGWSRTYAYVVGAGGTVRPGDPVRMLP
jgi:MOSC domain-containing protein YiiM